MQVGDGEDCSCFVRLIVAGRCCNGRAEMGAEVFLFGFEFGGFFAEGGCGGVEGVELGVMEDCIVGEEWEE